MFDFLQIFTMLYQILMELANSYLCGMGQRSLHFVDPTLAQV